MKPFAPPPPLIVGFGENSVDHVCRLAGLPDPSRAHSKIEIERRDIRPGGQVATTLATCARLGLATRYVGTFGDDEGAACVRQALERHGVEVSHASVRTAPNRYALILVDAAHGERLILWQRDGRLRIAPEEVRPEWLDNSTLLHVDATDEDAAIALARLARQRGVPVTCDIDRVASRTQELLESVTIPIVAESVPSSLTGQHDVEAALRAMKQPHHTHVIVTLGARGSAMVHDDDYVTVPAVAVNAVDTTGAGDVFRGAFICALLRGDGPHACLRFANAAAAVSCTREGALESVPTIDEVAALQQRV